MSKKTFFLLAAFLGAANGLFAQNEVHRSIHYEESVYYARHFQPETKLTDTFPVTPKSSCNLTHRVFGYHPYWGTTTWQSYRWDLLSDLCYFSWDVDSATGNAVNTNGWATAAVIDTAKAHGVKVHLCIVMFDGFTYFLNNSSAKQNLINNIIAAMQQRNADGVNIDFEGVPLSQKNNLTNFLISLCNQVHAAIPGSEVSIAAPAVNWDGTFDIAALNAYLDFFVVMGYDYYWSGSNQAGPVDGLYSMTGGTNDNLSRSITYYLNAGASPSKLIMALPYYGREWQTVSNSVPSSTVAGTSAALTYKNIRDNTSGYYSPANKRWENNSQTPYYVYNNGSWKQCFALDSRSFGRRLDMIRMRGIAGTGMWALGYDNGYPDLWNMIESKMTDCVQIPCTDTLYDLGGPVFNHFNNEQFIYTIAPSGASSLSLQFISFDLESGYDSLWIHDGASVSSPLIGGYSGTAGPGTVSSSGNALTLRFYSDNATTRPGWSAVWLCASDNQPPQTMVSSCCPWQTGDFTADFTDTDNAGIGYRFWLPSDYNGSEWRANQSRGFFCDYFDTALHPDWTAISGNWSVSTGSLQQSDQTSVNTNLYAPLAQDNSTSWLYQWKMRISGSGSNRRAGLYFFCDDATQSNRHNSYLVYYRADQDKVQIYKYVNNTMNLMTDDDCVVDPNIWYDCKVIFNPASGLIRAYLNDQVVSEWTDPSPWNSGNAVSFRTGECSVSIDDLKVFRSRGQQTLVEAGTSAQHHIRFANQNPSLASCRIHSLASDVNKLMSLPAQLLVNIDFTAPTAPTAVIDGLTADIDLLQWPDQPCGHWHPSSDAQSGLSYYLYSLGNSPGDSSLTGWVVVSDTLTGSIVTSLADGQWYYLNVKARNQAGLYSAHASSDGFLTQLFTGNVSAADPDSDLNVFPNPFSEHFVISMDVISGNHTVSLYDVSGRMLSSRSECFTQGHVMMHAGAEAFGMISPGIYFLVVEDGKNFRTLKLIKE